MTISPSDLFVDIETRSSLDLTKVGAYRYAEQDDTEVILLGYAFGEDPVVMWEIGDDPEEVVLALAMAERIVAHNAAFERLVLTAKDWTDRPTADWHCTMAQAFSHSLPGGLDQLCRFLGVADGKIGGGKALMKIFCRPYHGRFIAPDDQPERWHAFREYGRQDVVAMREAYRTMPRMNMG